MVHSNRLSFAPLFSKFRVCFMICVSPFLSFLVAVLFHTNQDRRCLPLFYVEASITGILRALIQTYST